MDKRNIPIRKFRTEDAETVSEIIRNNLINERNKACSEAAAKSITDGFSPKFVLTMSNKKKMYVATEEGLVIGTASIDFDTISDVFVDVEYHSKGIDKMLISLLEEIAANNGIMLVKLAAAFTVQKRYEKLGYAAVEEIEAGELGKMILMEKYLI